MRTLFSLLVLATFAVSAPAQQPPARLDHAPDTYASAAIDADGQLRIRTTDGRVLTPPKEGGQVGFSRAAVSPDNRAVAWLTLYPNCCTSYPLPMNLLMYTGGAGVTRMAGNGLPIWRWCFLAEGKQVAFEQETVHGHLGVHYELHDVTTSSLVADYDPKWDDDEDKFPDWVKAIDAAK
jgi:hypothetical protein